MNATTTPAIEQAEIERLSELLLAWTPEWDDRVQPLLLAQASRRDASNWSCGDAMTVVAFLLSMGDQLSARQRQAFEAREAEEWGYTKWRASGLPTERAYIEDMANVGEALMETLADNCEHPILKGWHCADCPSEIVTDLLNDLDESAAREARLREALERFVTRFEESSPLGAGGLHGEVQLARAALAQSGDGK